MLVALAAPGRAGLRDVRTAAAAAAAAATAATAAATACRSYHDRNHDRFFQPPYVDVTFPPYVERLERWNRPKDHPIKKLGRRHDGTAILSPRYFPGVVDQALSAKAREGRAVILAIETSFDDTACAVMRSDGTTLAREEYSEPAGLKLAGGIVPKSAAEVHARNLPLVCQRVLGQAGVAACELDAVAVTAGPGQSLALMAGRDFVRTLALEHELPVVPVHHMEAHLLSAGGPAAPLLFPLVALLASGAHCELLLARALGDYYRLGYTMDDAPGEAFDKTARALALDLAGPGGGGGALEREARLFEGDPGALLLSEPLKLSWDCRFSFSGLKTAAIAYATVGDGDGHVSVPAVAASFQHAVAAHLATRVTRAFRFLQLRDAGAARADGAVVGPCRSLVLSGGVASNATVRKQLEMVCARQLGGAVKLRVPPRHLCTDNAVMIASAAVERLRAGLPCVVTPVQYQYLSFEPVWPLGPDCSREVFELQVPTNRQAFNGRLMRARAMRKKSAAKKQGVAVTATPYPVTIGDQRPMAKRPTVPSGGGGSLGHARRN